MSGVRKMVLWLCLMLIGASFGSCSGPHLREYAEAPHEPAGPWEYRWGDSPRDQNGHLVWLSSDANGDSGSWQSNGQSVRPEGHGSNRYLWLRTRLDGPRVANPALYFLIVEQLFEAYLDGQLIYRFGELDGDGPEARRFLGNRTHMISLPADYSGRQLVLRIYSSHTSIGVSGQVRVGSTSGIFAVMLHEDAVDATVGVLLSAVGIFVIGLFLIQRVDTSYLLYGCFALSMGIWILCQMQIRTFFIDAPLGWLTLEIFSLYAAVAFLLRYILDLFGKGPLGLVRVLAHVVSAYAIGAAVAVGIFKVSILTTLVPFHILMLTGIVYLLVMMGILSLRGHGEARLFAIGFLVSALFGAHDILAVQGFLPRSQITFSQFGQGAFVLSLGLILARRFRRVYLTLEKAEKTLSEKVVTLEERNREVQQLNDDLRRQIEARSKDLAASILGASSSFSEIEVQILRAGSILADRYRVIRLIGQGGMGAVYEVERLTDGRHLAAKVLSVQAGKRGLARFAREAQLLAKLRHPNLVNIQDVDMTQSHMAYIVMELVAGKNLGALSERFGDLEFARKVLRQIADALASVHGQGIVHRDLKPENVLIQHPEDPAALNVKLVDFGVSMVLDRNVGAVPVGMGTSSAPIGHEGIPDDGFGITIADERSPSPPEPKPAPEGREKISGRPAELTQTGVIMGTPLYMAPELRQGAKYARPSSDMFSFGVMAYEIIAGQLPSEQPPLFHVFTPGKLWYTSLRVKCPDVPQHIADIIDRCLDPQPEKRPSADEVKAAFDS